MNSPLYTDLPTLDDKLELADEVNRMCSRIKGCHTPHVLGIHGDWGSGKTSFMRQIQRKLGGEMPKDASVDTTSSVFSAAATKKLQKEAVTIWFDAWRYQNEPAPVVALLQEMRRQMSGMKSVMSQFSKLSEIAVASILDSLSEIGKTISLDSLPSAEKIEKRGERWEKEHYSEAVAANSIREHLSKTIECLLPQEGARVIVFIDDLDRCSPKAAIRLLEGLKIYLTIPNCIFVLGMNERVLVDAIREELSAPKDMSTDEARLRAAHYLEKICTDIYRLPLPTSSTALLSHWIDNIHQKQALISAVGSIPCLPPNPRRLKSLANQWSRFANCIPFPQEDVMAQKYWAVRILVTAYIHQFHRDLWERWHFAPDFWNEIMAFCNYELQDPIPEWARSLKMTSPQISEFSASKPIYPNPGDIDNFWIATLVREYKDHLSSRDFKMLISGKASLL